MGKSLRILCTSNAGSEWISWGVLTTVLIPPPPNSAPRLQQGVHRKGVHWKPWLLPACLPRQASPDGHAPAASSCDRGTHWRKPAAARGVLQLHRVRGSED